MDNSPYILSIEETHGKSVQHGFHLGTDLQLARKIVEDKFQARRKYGIPVVTMALIRERKIVDVYDGAWSSEQNWCEK